MSGVFDKAVKAGFNMTDKAIANKRRRLTPEEKRYLFERQRGRCGICGEPMSLDEVMHADHIINFFRPGATNFLANLRLAHANCNLKRGAKFIS